MESNPSMGALTAKAGAKVNLSLRVLGRRPDGYHDIVSLVAFAAFGDRLSLEPGDELSLSVEGPFAAHLGANNLVLAAARRFLELLPGARPGAFRLVKRLPVAAGLGGGSADAAAALKLLMRANGVALAADEVTDICAGLGADVRVCFEGRASLVWGTGARLVAMAPLPDVPAVLVNPGAPLSTADVYGALGAAPVSTAAVAPEAPGPFADVAALAEYLAPLANDLEPPATRLAPVIAEVEEALMAQSGALTARLSGSGASVFALYRGSDAAAAAARRIGRVHPGWWVEATTLA